MLNIIQLYTSDYQKKEFMKHDNVLLIFKQYSIKKDKKNYLSIIEEKKNVKR